MKKQVTLQRRSTEHPPPTPPPHPTPDKSSRKRTLLSWIDSLGFYFGGMYECSPQNKFYYSHCESMYLRLGRKYFLFAWIN